jgi:hypothetical protein
MVIIKKFLESLEVFKIDPSRFESKIYPFFQIFSFPLELLNNITIFLVQLDLKLFTQSVSPSFIEMMPETSYTGYNCFYYFKRYEKSKLNLNEVKQLFAYAMRYKLYVYFSIDNTKVMFQTLEKEEKEEEEEEEVIGEHPAHAMYAIPKDGESFILKNSWANVKTDIIVTFTDLIDINMKTAIKFGMIYYPEYIRKKHVRGGSKKNSSKNGIKTRRKYVRK